MEKKLCKKNEGKMLFGVCSGVADYFGVDPTLIRLIWVLCGFFYGIGGLAYLIAAIVLPEKTTRTIPEQREEKKDTPPEESAEKKNAE